MMPCKCKCIGAVQCLSTMRAGKRYRADHGLQPVVVPCLRGSGGLLTLLSLTRPPTHPLNFSLFLQVAAAGTKEEGFSRLERINQDRSSRIGTALRRCT